jgi:hypothetical protein
MRDPKTERQMVERHIALGREHIARQLETIDKLRSHGYPTDGAERLLGKLEHLQRLHEAHLERLQNSN